MGTVLVSDVLSADAFGVVDTQHVAHLRNPSDVRRSLCGKRIVAPVPYGERRWRMSTGHADGQHCIECDRAYRSAHPGHVPLTYDF